MTTNLIKTEKKVQEKTIIANSLVYSISVSSLSLIGLFFVVDYYSFEVGFLYLIFSALGFHKLGHKLNILSPKDKQ